MATIKNNAPDIFLEIRALLKHKFMLCGLECAASFMSTV